MTLSLDRINKARQAGYSDEDIIDSIERKDPTFGSRIKKAKEVGYDSVAIMDSIEKRLNSTSTNTAQQNPTPNSTQNPIANPQERAKTALNQFKPKTSPASTLVNATGNGSFFSSETDNAFNQNRLGQSFRQGLKSSTSGELGRLAFGYEPTEEDIKNPGFWESLVQTSGNLVGNSPYYAPGAALGASVGAALGAPGGAAGAGIGGAAGGAFGAFAFPAFLEESLKQYREYVAKGHDLTFGEFLERADKVANRTLNEGLFGTILGAVNRASPLLQNVPGIGNLFKSKISQKAAGIGLETAALAGVHPVTEGRLPDSEDFSKSLALVLGLNLLHVPSALKKIQKTAKETGLSSEQIATEMAKESKGKINSIDGLDRVLMRVYENTLGQEKPQDVAREILRENEPREIKAEHQKTPKGIAEKVQFATTSPEGEAQRILKEHNNEPAQVEIRNKEEEEFQEEQKKARVEKKTERGERLTKNIRSGEIESEQVRAQTAQQTSELSGNRKTVAQRAVRQGYVHTPEQLERFIKDYEEVYPSLQGNVKDRNRKFLNQYLKKNKRKLEPKAEIKEIPTPKLSEQDKLKIAVVELRRAKGEKDKAAIKEAQRKLDLQKTKIRRQEQQKKEEKVNIKYRENPLEIRIEPKEIPKEEIPEHTSNSYFKTSKGSTYKINENGSTTRDKAFRIEHGENEQGPQTTSDKTYYISPEEAQKLGEVQTKGNSKAIVEFPDGRLGVIYLTGKDKGKVESRTVVTPESSPQLGSIPIELWDNGTKVHFGNEITEIFEDNKLKENSVTKKNIYALEEKLEKAKAKGDTARISVLSKNLTIQREKVKKKKKEAVPIIETTGKSAHEQIDIPKTFSERIVRAVNTAIDAIKNPRAALSRTGQAINESVFNFLAPIERLENQIPVEDQVTSRIKLAQTSTSTINAVIENGIFSDIGTKIEHGGLKSAYGDYTWSRLTKKMKPGEYSIQELDEYRASKQALKRQKEGKVTGIDTEEAAQDVEHLKEKYEPIDEKIRDYNKAVTAHYGKDLLGEELINNWNSDYHTSLYRVMDSGEGSMLATGSLEPKKSFFAFKGSKRKIIPASESDVYNTALLIQNSKKNDAVLQYKKNVEKGLLPGKIKTSEKSKVPKSVVDQLEVPSELRQVADNLYGQTRAEAFTPSKDTLRGWENGFPFEIEVPQEVVEVFKGLQPIQQPAIYKALLSVNKVFSKGLTLDPRKFFSIHARDALSAMIYSRTGVNPIDTAKATAEVLGDSDLYKQFKFDGGDTYASRLSSRVDRASTVNELVTPGKSGPIVPLNKFYGYMKRYAKSLGDISTAVPFAEYKKGLEKYGNTAEGRILAMMDAKKSTYDPNRKGKSRVIREIAPFMNFWNVTLQDLSMVGENLQRPEVWAKGIAAVTLPTLALKAWNEGNPLYDELTAIDKAAFWHMFFGDTHIRIPIPWLLGTVFKVVPETMYDISQGNTKEGSKALYHNAVDQVSGTFNPLVQTGIELLTGKSPPSPIGAVLGVESRSPEVVPRRLQNLPKEHQYTANTSVLSKTVAPLINLSPVIMDRVISNLGANVAKDTLALIDEIAYQTGFAEDKRPEKALSNYLLLGNFVQNSPPTYTKYAQEFYELLEAQRLAKGASKLGLPMDELKKLQKIGLNNYNTRISKRYQRYRQIQDSEMPADEKKESLDRIQKEINALYKQAVERAHS